MKTFKEIRERDEREREREREREIRVPRRLASSLMSLFLVCILVAPTSYLNPPMATVASLPPTDSRSNRVMVAPEGKGEEEGSSPPPGLGGGEKRALRK